MRLRKLALSCGAVWVVCLVTATQASVTTLQSLLGGGTFTVSDKVFSNFTITSPIGLTAADIIVVPAPTPPPGEHGLRFTSTKFVANMQVTLGYDVVSNIGNLISDITLKAQGSVLTTGTGVWLVNETVTPGGSFAQVFQSVPNASPQTLSQHVVFTTPLTSAHVSKFITVSSANNSASIAYIDQTFSQIAPAPTVIPLPSAVWSGMALLVVGGLVRTGRTLCRK